MNNNNNRCRRSPTNHFFAFPFIHCLRKQFLFFLRLFGNRFCLALPLICCVRAFLSLSLSVSRENVGRSIAIDCVCSCFALFIVCFSLIGEIENRWQWAQRHTNSLSWAIKSRKSKKIAIVFMSIDLNSRMKSKSVEHSHRVENKFAQYGLFWWEKTSRKKPMKKNEVEMKWQCREIRHSILSLFLTFSLRAYTQNQQLSVELLMLFFSKHSHTQKKSPSIVSWIQTFYIQHTHKLVYNRTHSLA